jgi:integrase
MGRKYKNNKKYKGVQQTSNTSLRIGFSYKGKQQYETRECDPTDEKAWQEAAEIVVDVKREIRDGTFDYLRWFPDSKKGKKYEPTGGAFLKDYLPYFMKVRKNGIQKMGKKPISNSSYAYYVRTITNQLIPAFGDLCVDEIAADDVYAWGEKYGKTTTTNTLSNIISPLRVALDFAVLEKKINVNPIKNITLYGKRKNEKVSKHDPFDRDEIKDILMACKGQMHNYLRFSIFTGLRPSEVCALTWDDYDPVHKTINVDKALTDADEDVGEVKTAASERTVHLSPTAVWALTCQKVHTKLAGKEIFHNPHSNVAWKGSAPIRKQFQVVCKNAGVRYRKPYQTRHTYASMQLTVGENLAFISQQMGHTDVAFTLRTYASYIQTYKPDAGYKADAEFTDLELSGKDKKLVVLKK